MKQKAIVYQLLSTIALLLIIQKSAAVLYAWTVIDFVMLADYWSHSDETLWYMNQVLYWINKLKEIFWHFCSKNENDREYFNFFKFHIIMYYSEFIYKYESVNEIDSSHFEVLHRHLVKKFFAHINKRDDFQKQIL